MPKSVRSLDQIAIASPCEADWDSMAGNDRVRFCEHCQLHVNNLSAMTRQQAMRLVAQSRGRLCVRYVRRADGEILTRQIPRQLHQIARKTSRLAAAAFSATLSVASAAAQTRVDNTACAVQPPQRASSVSTPVDQTGVISGIVRDPNRAVVPHATVTLVNPGTNLSFIYVTQDDGAFKFALLDAGTYNVSVEAAGFATHEIKNLEVSPSSTKTVDVDLNLQIITAMVEVQLQPIETVEVLSGAVAISEPKDPLVKAAHKDDLAAVKNLLASGAEVDKWDELTDANALCYAIENHNREMIRVLLSAGANINSTEEKVGSTPLMYLNEGATIEMVRDLLSARADVNAKDGNDCSVLASIIGRAPLDVVKELINAGARIDTKDNQGTTVLMRAAENEDPSVVKLLISAGLDVTARDDDDESALTRAARTARSKNVKVLLDAGGAAALKGDELDSLLLEVASGDDPQVIKLLIDAGADYAVKASDGATTLMHAAQYGKAEAVRMLISAGVKIDAQDNDGYTALMLATDLENVQLLLDAGADLTVKNNSGKTALGVATEKNREDIVKLLKSRGAPE